VLGADQLWNCSANATVTGQVSGAHALTVCMNYYNGSWSLALTNNDNNSFGGLTVLGAPADQYPVRAWPKGNSTILGNGPVTLSNAILRLDNAGATAATVTITNLIAQGGSRLFIGNPNSASTTTLAGSDLMRSGHGQLIITTLSNSLAAKELLTLTGPTFALTNGIIAPRVARATSAAGMDPGDFVTYGGNGVSPAAYHVGFDAGSGTEVAILTNATTTLSAAEQ